MSDTYVTLHGWVGSDVTYRDPQGISVANFRVASTPRLKKEGKWVDGDTTWYSVTVWRHLADNIRDSVRKGDAVVVHGRLRTDTWKREDGRAEQHAADRGQPGRPRPDPGDQPVHSGRRGRNSAPRARWTPRPRRSPGRCPTDLPAQVDSWGNAAWPPAEEDQPTTSTPPEPVRPRLGVSGRPP